MPKSQSPEMYRVLLKPDQVWSLHEHYDVMVACGDDPTLAGVGPLLRCDGGFVWSTGPNESFEGPTTNQIRTSHQWGVPRMITSAKTWRESMPTQADFDAKSLVNIWWRGKQRRGFFLYEVEPTVPDQRLRALVKVLKRLGYDVQRS